VLVKLRPFVVLEGIPLAICKPNGTISALPRLEGWRVATDPAA